jgi:tetratricopeptide (TPR) repeat protein
LDYNLARTYIDAGLYLHATALLERLGEKWPRESRFGIELASCYEALGRIREAREVAEKVMKLKDEDVDQARRELQAWHQAHGMKEPKELSAAERRTLRPLRSRIAVNPFAVEYLLGSLLFAEGDTDGALAHLARAGQVESRNPSLHLKLGEVYLKMRRWHEAERCLRQALELDPDNARAWTGLARCLLSLRSNSEATSAAIEAVGLIFHNPRAHYLLGLGLECLGETEHAIRALKVAVNQNENFVAAHMRLSQIYRARLDDTLKATEHRAMARVVAERMRHRRRERFPDAAEAARGLFPPATDDDMPASHFPLHHAAEGKGILPPEPLRYADEVPFFPPPDLSRTIVVVSGLPRSGTSMMMQMLLAGGLEVLTDETRGADENNPRGYLEFAPVRKLLRDNSWLPEAQGKAVKIVADLLPGLAKGYEYRILFMERELAGVLRSQQKMLDRQGKEGTGLSIEGLAKAFAWRLTRIKEWLVRRGIPTLFVSYGECIRQPLASTARVNAFLGGGLKELDMAAVVEPGLYRERS